MKLPKELQELKDLQKEKEAIFAKDLITVKYTYDENIT